MSNFLSKELDKHYDRRVELRLQVDKLEAAIQRVRELHTAGIGNMCNTCSGDCWSCNEWGCKGDPCQDDCHVYFPCPTLKALDGEQ